MKKHRKLFSTLKRKLTTGYHNFQAVLKDLARFVQCQRGAIWYTSQRTIKGFFCFQCITGIVSKRLSLHSSQVVHNPGTYFRINSMWKNFFIFLPDKLPMNQWPNGSKMQEEISKHKINWFYCWDNALHYVLSRHDWSSHLYTQL